MIRSTGKFVYGFPQVNRDGRVVIVWQDTKNKWFGEQVVPETLGQLTGLEDKNGDPIYEGDILQDKSWKGKKPTGAMKWDGWGWSQFAPLERFEIIGNIHQNKDLLNENN
jgi:hypothetical protein